MTKEKQSEETSTDKPKDEKPAGELSNETLDQVSGGLVGVKYKSPLPPQI